MYSQIPYAEITSKTVQFTVYDFDRFSKHDQIGQIKVPLSTVDLCNVIEEWRELNPPEGEGEKNDYVAIWWIGIVSSIQNVYFILSGPRYMDVPSFSVSNAVLTGAHIQNSTFQTLKSNLQTTCDPSDETRILDSTANHH
ncbi:unnamed protein product [Trichobilharzia regenti]|nr:unnamed protein product [Trichobilharzia regenti]